MLECTAKDTYMSTELTGTQHESSVIATEDRPSLNSGEAEERSPSIYFTSCTVTAKAVAEKSSILRSSGCRYL